MFGHQHYVPVMRIKPAERRALRTLDAALRSRTSPLLECPPRVLHGCDTRAKLERRLDHVVEDIAGWNRRSVFIDFSTLQSAAPDALEVMVSRAAVAGIRAVPVVSLKTGAGTPYARCVRTLLDRHGAALCLRLSPEELKLSSIGEMIEQCLKLYGANVALTDLVIDRGLVNSGTTTYEEFAHLIPSLDEWRTLTLLAGSFPPDLSGLAPGNTYRLPRFEWRQWQALDSWPMRRPAFGDYTIQYVRIKESVPSPNPSASIRYTTEDEYLVLRGEGILNKRGPGRAQWNAWAALLMGRPEYFGATFSDGDRYIAERAIDANRSGSPQTWLRAGFSHHLTTTALQVAGRLAEARRVSGTAAASWTSVVRVEQPEVAL